MQISPRFLAIHATALGMAIASALLINVVPADAAPVREPLAPQVEMGPTLHPSGNDRLVENGGSGTQGKAHSDPDGAYNYGIDQTGEDGGLYLGDQDGNNGCGNDQDFEDDNNGICGRAKDEECVEPDTSSSDPTYTEWFLPGNATTTNANGKPFAEPEVCDTDDTDTDTEPSTGTDTGTSDGDIFDTSVWSSLF